HKYNWACLIKRRIGDDSLVYDFEEPDYKTILPQCQRTQEFLGCPQSFCYNHAVDDFTIATIEGSKQIVLFRGSYYWLLKITPKLPLQLPLVNDAKLIANNKLWPKMTNVRYIDACEAFTINGEQIVLIFKDDKVLSVIKGITTVTSIETIFKQRDKKDIEVDTAWFQATTNKLYLFSRDHFQVYNMQMKGNTLIAQLDPPLVHRINAEMKGLPTIITASLSLDKHVYFLRDLHYYKGNIDNIFSKFIGVVTFDPKHKFFETEADPCKIDESTFKTQYLPKIEKHMKTEDGGFNINPVGINPVNPVNKDPPEVDKDDSDSDSDGKKTSSKHMTVMIIVGTAAVISVVILIAAGIGYFVFYGKKYKQISTQAKKSPLESKPIQPKTTANKPLQANRAARSAVLSKSKKTRKIR
ncbi:hypothetical protein B4U80_11858, partial [Leptotrombidium deliense]